MTPSLGLVAQSVERSTVTAEVAGSKPVQTAINGGHMKRVILDVRSCTQCPHRKEQKCTQVQDDYGNDNGVNITFSPIDRYISLPSCIPSWCPLDDVE